MAKPEQVRPSEVTASSMKHNQGDHLEFSRRGLEPLQTGRQGAPPPSETPELANLAGAQAPPQSMRGGLEHGRVRESPPIILIQLKSETDLLSPILQRRKLKPGLTRGHIANYSQD